MKTNDMKGQTRKVIREAMKSRGIGMWNMARVIKMSGVKFSNNLYGTGEFRPHEVDEIMDRLGKRVVLMVMES